MTQTFIDDLEKMTDLLKVIMSDDNGKAYDNFLMSYSYVTKNELDDTIKKINGHTLADLYRQAENFYIEEINDRATGLTITSEEAKAAISRYIFKSGLCSKADIRAFIEDCDNMAC